MAINVIAIIYDISFKKSLPESLYNCYKCKDKSFKMKTSRLTLDLQNQVVQLVLVVLSTIQDENIKTHSRSPKQSRPARPSRPSTIQDDNIKLHFKT